MFVATEGTADALGLLDGGWCLAERGSSCQSVGLMLLGVALCVKHSDSPGGRPIQAQNSGLLHPQDREVRGALPIVIKRKQDQTTLPQTNVAAAIAVCPGVRGVPIVPGADQTRESGDAHMGVLFALNRQRSCCVTLCQIASSGAATGASAARSS
ncbi:unnamed protein product [Phytophthora lilii]|uniref:Unnamed protein product n=1 Tax=Phytophthora lilii TaxID=2077276 RepID=A0A9W6X8S6_9STRA|nr:unnamed protein product [Phytophthora lilii]